MGRLPTAIFEVVAVEKEDETSSAGGVSASSTATRKRLPREPTHSLCMGTLSGTTSLLVSPPPPQNKPDQQHKQQRKQDGAARFSSCRPAPNSARGCLSDILRRWVVEGQNGGLDNKRAQPQRVLQPSSAPMEKREREAPPSFSSYSRRRGGGGGGCPSRTVHCFSTLSWRLNPPVARGAAAAAATTTATPAPPAAAVFAAGGAREPGREGMRHHNSGRPPPTTQPLRMLRQQIPPRLAVQPHRV